MLVFWEARKRFMIIMKVDCILFNVPLENFSLIWRRHHLHVESYKFCPILGTQCHWTGRDLFLCQHLLRHRTSVYMVSSEGPVSTSHSEIRTRDVRIESLLRDSIADALTTEQRGRPIWALLKSENFIDLSHENLSFLWRIGFLWNRKEEYFLDALFCQR